MPANAPLTSALAAWSSSTRNCSLARGFKSTLDRLIGDEAIGVATKICVTVSIKFFEQIHPEMTF